MDFLPSPTRPPVSLVLATHDRPDFLPIVLECYRRQTYEPRELIVVDDSDPPIDEDAIAGVGGQLLRVRQGTVHGEKLNRGLEHARGQLGMKIDDDDWYAPDYVQRTVAAVVETWIGVTPRIAAALLPFRFFDLRRWEVRENVSTNFSGGTLTFLLDDWRRAPFRAVQRQMDAWFARDQVAAGTRFIAVRAPDSYLALRHDRHVWVANDDGTSLDDHIRGLPLYEGGPDALLPEWAVNSYRNLREKLLEGSLNGRVVTRSAGDRAHVGAASGLNGPADT